MTERRRPLPAAAAREPRSRPDPGPLRVALGLTGVAALSAIATAVAGAATGAANATGPTPLALEAPGPSAPVQHVTRYVQLRPGQTAPPQATVTQQPAPSPRVVVVTTTRQSGLP
jgi:hypothetical protein